jgi:DNA-binding CsgD family transcriptional regulator
MEYSVCGGMAAMAGKRQLYLTEGQKDCLRLVDDLLTSKEIARKLGISPFTVDQRLDAARRKLNAPSRKTAARIYLELEARSLPQPLVYYPEHIADVDFIAMLPRDTCGEAERSDTISSTHPIGQQTDVCGSVVCKSTDQPKSYAAIIKALLETGLISVIMVSTMILILAGLLRALS